jgi:hypothetical protein
VLNLLSRLGLIQESACAAAKFLPEVLAYVIEDQSHTVAEDQSHTVETTSADDDDRDSVFGSQSVVEETANQFGATTMSWAKIREVLIPSSVKNITFAVSKEDSNPEPITDDQLQKIRDDFPGVTVLPAPDKLPTPTPSPSERQNDRSCNGEKLRTQRTPFKLDPIQHLCDLSDYATQIPTEEDFGHELREHWHALPYARKIDFAHARAIQGPYGKSPNNSSGACSHCIERDLQCRVYTPQLRNLSHMTLGASCQHCRLGGADCSLTQPTKTLRLDTQELDTRDSTDVSDTPVTATSKPSLASRMSFGPETPSDSGVLDLAAKLGLNLKVHVKPVIQAMYRQWKTKSEVKPFSPKRGTIQHFYSNLVTISILANAMKNSEWEYAVLLRFQTTNYQCTTNLPNIETAVYAYEHLPAESPLCRWIAIMYSFLWSCEDAEYKGFSKKHPGIDTTALSKLLYAVAHTRDPFTKGCDEAVLSRWCAVHNHADAVADQPEPLCEASLAIVTTKLAIAADTELKNKLEELKEDLEQYGCMAKLNQQIAAINQRLRDLKKKSKVGKRTAEDSLVPTTASKKKRGG